MFPINCLKKHAYNRSCRTCIGPCSFALCIFLQRNNTPGSKVFRIMAWCAITFPRIGRYIYFLWEFIDEVPYKKLYLRNRQSSLCNSTIHSDFEANIHIMKCLPSQASHFFKNWCEFVCQYFFQEMLRYFSSKQINSVMNLAALYPYLLFPLFTACFPFYSCNDGELRLCLM